MGRPRASTTRPRRVLPGGRRAGGRGAALVAFLELGDIAEEDAADLVFLEVEAMPMTSPGNWTISLYITSESPSTWRRRRRGADVADVLLDRLGLEFGDLLLDCSMTELMGRVR
jgi:hypothetical protein